VHYEEVQAILPGSKEEAKSTKRDSPDNGARLPVTIDREKKATSFGIMPTGRRSWRRNRHSNDL